MCNHANKKKFGEVYVCLKCGLTILPDGRIFFDRKLPNYRPKKQKNKKRGTK